MDESDSGRTERLGRESWVTRWLRREKPAAAPPVAVRPAPRPPQTREDIIATYTRIVQGFVDDNPAERPMTVSVCGVGPMSVNVDDDGKVFLTPRASM